MFIGSLQGDVGSNPNLAGAGLGGSVEADTATFTTSGYTLSTDPRGGDKMAGLGCCGGLFSLVCWIVEDFR